MVSSQRITIPFFKFRQRQRIFINFQQQLKASINTNTKPFKIQMSDKLWDPPWQGLLTVTDILTACVAVIFRVKASCIMSVDGIIIV